MPLGQLHLLSSGGRGSPELRAVGPREWLPAVAPATLCARDSARFLCIHGVHVQARVRQMHTTTNTFALASVLQKALPVQHLQLYGMAIHTGGFFSHRTVHMFTNRALAVKVAATLGLYLSKYGLVAGAKLVTPLHGMLTDGKWVWDDSDSRRRRYLFAEFAAEMQCAH